MGEARRLAAWNIRKLRVARHLSIEALAFRAGIAAGSLARIEREAINPSLDILERVATALAVPIRVLFAPVRTRPKPLPSGRRKRTRD
jgi:transcriptional regulator with XRE-family HTH domain